MATEYYMDAITQTPYHANSFEASAYPYNANAPIAASAVAIAAPYISSGSTLLSVIQTLDTPFLVKQPIQVEIQRVDDAYVASFENANLSASGDNWIDALTNLKGYLTDIFDELIESRDILGPGLRHDLEVLEQFVGKHPDAQQG